MRSVSAGFVRRVVAGSAIAAGIAVAGCGDDKTPTGSGELEPPVTDLSGSWSVSSRDDGTDCGDGVTTNIYTILVTQMGNDLTVQAPTGTFAGIIAGRTVTWSGSFPEGGGTTTIANLILTVEADENGLVGSSSWSWTDGVDACAGTSEITAVRL